MKPHSGRPVVSDPKNLMLDHRSDNTAYRSKETPFMAKPLPLHDHHRSGDTEESKVVFKLEHLSLLPHHLDNKVDDKGTQMEWEKSRQT